MVPRNDSSTPDMKNPASARRALEEPSGSNTPDGAAAPETIVGSGK